jgi:predicted  nucleic acid-binding Zn-ribbon protein
MERKDLLSIGIQLMDAIKKADKYDALMKKKQEDDSWKDVATKEIESLNARIEVLGNTIAGLRLQNQQLRKKIKNSGKQAELNFDDSTRKEI